MANPEVETSGKSSFATSEDFLPLTPNLEDDLSLFDEAIAQGDDAQVQTGWRLEQNSNGYYRWRWQKKNNGVPETYVNKSGNTAYARGSKYVPIKEAKRHINE